MKHATIKVLSLVPLLALAGCSLISESNIPQIEQPVSLRSGTPITNEAKTFATYAWWEKLDDPQLNFLIEESLKKNHDIEIAVANVELAEAQLRSARYAWLPTLDAQGGGIGSGGIDTTYTNRGSTNLSGGLGRLSVAYGGFVPSYSLNVFAVINQIHLAEASLEIQKASYNAVRLAVIGQVSGSYFNLLCARRELMLQEQKVIALTNLRSVTHARLSAGANNATEVYDTDQRLMQARASLAGIRDDIAKTENAIQILTGKMPASVKTDKNPLAISPDELIPAELPSAVLHQRPDMLMAENNLRAADAQIGIANAAFFPNISLTGFVGGASVMLTNIFSVQGGFWAATGTVTAPVLNARKLADVSASEAKQRAAYANYLQTVKSVFTDVDDQLTGMQLANERYADLAAARDSGYKLLGISRARFETGAADKRSLLEAEIVFIEIQKAENTGKSQQLSKLVNVFQSLAGGYAVQQGVYSFSPTK